jgi:hypothetical protein
MKIDSFSEYLAGPLALLCAIAVIVATAFDAQSAMAPAVAAVVKVAP